MSPVFSKSVAIAPDLSVVTISNGGKSCHLLLSGGASLLVNCIAGLESSAIIAAGHPVPEEIWHTQVDDALAAEGLRNVVIKDNVMDSGALKELILDRGGHGPGVLIKDNPGELFQKPTP